MLEAEASCTESTARGNISLTRGILCCSSPPTPYCEKYVYIYLHAFYCVQTVYELPLLPNNTAVKHFNTNRNCAKCRPDIYRWAAGLAVTGPIRDSGQNVLQSSFETASSSSSHSYCHGLFLSHSSRRPSLQI